MSGRGAVASPGRWACRSGSWFDRLTNHWSGPWTCRRNRI